MKQITQTFFVSKNFQCNIVAKTKSYFCNIKRDYITIECNSFLVFKYFKFNANENGNEFSEVWFSYQQLYPLIKTLKKFASLLEKKEDEIFYISDNNLVQIALEYKNFNSEIKAINNSLMIEFAIGENEYLNTDDIGINFYINSIDYKVFLNVDTFMSLSYYLQKLDLLLATQNMISIYLTNKQDLKTKSNIVEEG